MSTAYPKGTKSFIRGYSSGAIILAQMHQVPTKCCIEACLGESSTRMGDLLEVLVLHPIFPFHSNSPRWSNPFLFCSFFFHHAPRHHHPYPQLGYNSTWEGPAKASWRRFGVATMGKGSLGKNRWPHIENGQIQRLWQPIMDLPICPIDLLIMSFPKIYNNGESEG